MVTLLENEYGVDPHRFRSIQYRQRQGNGERYFEYEDVIQVFESNYDDDSRPAHQTTIVEINGHPIHYIFNKYGKLLFMEENTFRNGLIHHLIWRFRYNRDGRLVAMLSPEKGTNSISFWP